MREVENPMVIDELWSENESIEERERRRQEGAAEYWEE